MRTDTSMPREQDGLTECPLAPLDPATGLRADYTPPCTRQTDASGYRIYDGRGFLIFAVTS